ncbi:MAG TPA: tyrosine-type recombinase/integrase [Bryobacteraceae bacterium]
MEVLQQQLARVAQYGGCTHRVTIHALLNLLLKDYREQNRGSLYTTELRIEKHVRPAFGAIKANKLTSSDIRKYKESRLNTGASPGTINRELARLRRAFNLGAVEDPPLVYRVPRILALKEDNIREGFLEEPQYRALVAVLADSVKPVFVVAYHLGMRTGELLKIRRDWVDLAEGIIYITGRATKNRWPKTAPIYGDMRGWLEMQISRCQLLAPKTKDLWVWEDGSRMKSFRGTWETACEAVGLPGLLFHDLRRTAVRNMIRAGVPEKTAMAVSGHKTAAMLWRYNIVDTRDIIEAGKRTERYLQTLRSNEKPQPKELKQ